MGSEMNCGKEEWTKIIWRSKIFAIQFKKYVKDKVPNVTTEETSRKSLSGFLHKYKWSALEPDIYQDIEPDNYFEFRDTKVPDNKQNHNNIKQNYAWEHHERISCKRCWYNHACKHVWRKWWSLNIPDNSREAGEDH